MKIKFLRNCNAPQQWTKALCECCGPVQMGYESTYFYEGQEEDPNVFDYVIDLSGLTYRVDYDIIEYP